MPRTSGDFTNLVVFGDSLSDNGNLFARIGQPRLPYWQGRFSNGPVYAEQLAAWSGARLTDAAYGGATASPAAPGTATDPATGRKLPINLPDQVGRYIAGLHGAAPPPGTVALINIGSNDLKNDLESGQAKDPTSAQAVLTRSLAAIGGAIARLRTAGVGPVVLFTLPDLSITPRVRAAGTTAQAQTRRLEQAFNAGLRQLAASGTNIRLVDASALSQALAADPRAFGLADTSVPWLTHAAAGHATLAPNQVLFFDDLHPTTAAHAIQAAFAQAVLGTRDVQLPDATRSVVQAAPGGSFIFAAPHASTGLTIAGGPGPDTIYGGAGDVTVRGGAGSDIIFAGAGTARLDGGAGDDVLAASGPGRHTLRGGAGDDLLIAGRDGSNTLAGDAGDDLIVLKEGAGLVHPDGRFAFAPQTITGGPGQDTLRFIVSDRVPAAEQALAAEFRRIARAFDATRATGAHVRLDGLDISGIERLELQVDSVSTDPATPYRITHAITLSAGHTATEGPPASLTASAEHWGLLTV
ncbi:SGNH/GDSL hydrolase family protein [Rhodovastum atsumiense]|uniref:Uncharacterized protein n=1 Tax=Rhodovastum atsumiense TaxID=504468 RepID=A0A5M6IS17_9PROT|nr:SGNH/GDSL hydrolase family protein [Rhodovastum atsumiense]KAA5610275.1 hypothetical protein F1189_20045 [Rhodovastum atsumiense]